MRPGQNPAGSRAVGPGSRTISRIIAACGFDQQDWNADYRAFSHGPSQQQRLFEMPVAAGLEKTTQRDNFLVVGDFTHLGKIENMSPRCVACVTRQPPLAVAVYAMMLLEARKTYGSRRVDAYVPLPKWRIGAKRPSCQDIVSKLRREMESDPGRQTDFVKRTEVMAATTFQAAP